MNFSGQPNWRNPFQFLNQTNPHLRTSYAEGAKRVKLVKNRVCQIKRQMVVLYRICQQNPLTFTFFWTPLSMHHACAYCYMVTQVPFEVISWCCHRRRTTHWKVFRKASTLWACINIKLNRIPFWKGTFVEQKLCFLILENSFDDVLLYVVSFDFDGKLSSITHTHSISNWWFRDFRIFCKSLKNPTNIQ